MRPELELRESRLIDKTNLKLFGAVLIQKFRFDDGVLKARPKFP